MTLWPLALATSFSKTILWASPLCPFSSTSTFALAWRTFTLTAVADTPVMTPSHLPAAPPVFTYMLPAAAMRFWRLVLTPVFCSADSTSGCTFSSADSGQAVQRSFISCTSSGETPSVAYSSSRNSGVQGCTDTSSMSHSGGGGSTGISRVTLVVFGCSSSLHSFTFSSLTVHGSASQSQASQRQLTMMAASYSSSRLSCKVSIASFLSLKRPTASVQHESKFLHDSSSSDFQVQKVSSKSSWRSSHFSLVSVWFFVSSSHSSQTSLNSSQRPQKCSFIVFKYFSIS
mmetsp:Transcript_48653/g.115602  ORF Transcript_48653/g.115602 Transcript_48653/m.115602 type:complete len:287 (-) Transcript_48653:661-1521(-)